MKKINKLWLLAMPLAFVACQDNALEDVAQLPSAENGFTLRCTVDETPSTRAQVELYNLDRTQEYFMWNDNDQISVFESGASESKTFYIQGTGYDKNPTQTADFVSADALADGSTIAAIYPNVKDAVVADGKIGLAIPNYGDAQVTNRDEHSSEFEQGWREYMRNRMFMYASATVENGGADLQFRHLYAMARITFINATKSSQKLGTVGLTTDNAYFASRVAVDLATGEAEPITCDNVAWVTYQSVDRTMYPGETYEAYVIFFPGNDFAADGTIQVVNGETTTPAMNISAIAEANNGATGFEAGKRYRFTVAVTDDGLQWIKQDEAVAVECLDNILDNAYHTLYSQDDKFGFMGTNSLANWAFGDMIGGEGNKGSQAGDQPDLESLELWSINANNLFLKDRWRALYNGVAQANNVLKVSSMAGHSVQHEAEARFIKAVHMFEGIKIFGAHIPYITVEEYMYDANATGSNVDENGQLVYVWDKVEEDLKFAAENLPDTYDAEHKGHINKWAAKTLLAKLYLFWASPYGGVESNGANNAAAWSKATSLLDEIIANGQTSDGKTYGLHPSYAELYTPEGDWTSENVFDVQQYTEGGAWYYATILSQNATFPPGFSGWGFYQPTYEFVNNFIVDDNGLPAAGYRESSPLTYMAEGNSLVADLNTYVDPRVDLTVGRFEVPYYWIDKDRDGWGTPSSNNLWFYCRDYTNGGLYMTKKYIPMKYEENVLRHDSDKNQHVIRFAEVLLMRAECAIHNGDLETARWLINQVRERAANTDWWLLNTDRSYKGEVVGGTTVDKTAANYRIGLYTEPFASAEEATTALRREIRLEMGLEGKRWFNLTRWGCVADELNAFAAWESQYLPKYSDRYNPDWITLPIPSSMVNDKIVQNAVWR